MPGNRKLQRNASATDRVEEAMRRLKVDDDDKDRVGNEAGAYPDRPGEPDCIYYLRTGSCGYGSNCRFNHPSDARQVYDVKNTSELPERAGQPECGHYLRTGTCKYGPTCKYHHPKNRQVDVSMNILGLPMRQDARLCQYYMRTGLCKYGPDCKFHHPQPASAANVLPPAVGPIYGSGGTANAPSPGMISVEELSAVSMPKPTYFTGSFLQAPQNYMPLFLSQSQGWNTYMGNVSPLSIGSAFTTPASNGQLSVTNLPERPDQPECRYFMNHGSCKYGSDCKYHHPREKIMQLTSNSLGPLGLPIRPGQAVCSYYALYGLCRFGPACKYDHPLNGGYSYGYSLAVPPLASAYTSSIPYGMAPLMPPPDSSPAKPPRLSDWIKKGGATTNSKNQQSPNTKSVHGSPDKSDSIPRSSEASSEVIDNSD